MQLWHNFQVEMSPQEVAALISRLKGDYDGRLDCSQFLYEFFRMRAEHLSRHNQYEFYMKERRADFEVAFVEQFVERFAHTSPVKIWAATKEDMHSAFVKLKNAASYTRPDIFGNLQRSFDACDLDPTQFHKFLDRYFDVNLSPGELDATMRVFDLNGDGAISYGEFMTTFYQLGLEERSRRLLTQRTRLMQEEQARKEKTKKHIEAFNQELRSHIIFPILPEEDEVEENQPMDSLESEDGGGGGGGGGGTSASLPALSPTNPKKLASKSSPGKPQSILTQFPAISPATKDFLRQLEEEEKKIRRKKSKRTKAKKTVTLRHDGDGDYADVEGRHGGGGVDDRDGAALENWDFDPSSRVGGEIEHESASFVLGIDDDESAAVIADVDLDDKLGGDDAVPRQASSGRPDSRQVSLSRGSNRPDSRAFGRPDSRANSRGSLRQNSSEFRGPSSPPVNLSGLSGFRTGMVEEEESEYGGVGVEKF